MSLFSYHNGIPAPLPVELRGVDAERLASIGYSGPFPSPSFNPRTQQAQWTGSEWLIVTLSEEQIAQAESLRLLSRANWQGFTEGIMMSAPMARLVQQQQSACKLMWIALSLLPSWRMLALVVRILPALMLALLPLIVN
jgi:hypothetical protein